MPCLQQNDEWVQLSEERLGKIKPHKKATFSQPIGTRPAHADLD